MARFIKYFAPIYMMVRKLARYAQIAGILSKYGFGLFLQELFPEDRRPEFLKTPEIDSLDVYQRIRLAIEELGPTFIKFGQILSVRRDLLPPPLIDELLKLTDDVRPVEYEKVYTVIDETCGPLSEFCIFVDPEPFAAASLSQVHRASLIDGTDVVFKVQRPDIRELIEIDLTILENLAPRVESTFPYLRPFNPVGLVEEFSHQIRKELDFVRDGKNAETLSENLKDMLKIKIPKIYWEYSGPRLLVMEYIDGVRIDNIAAIRQKHDPKELAEIGFEAYVHQIFVDGFFHGDPHPGNLKVTDDGKLVFFDFGMVGVLRPARRLAYTRILYSIVTSDVQMLIDNFEDLDITIGSGDIERFKDEMYTIMRETQRYELHELTFLESMNEITSVFYRYHIQMPGSFMLMIKVIAMVGDIGLILDPDFNFIERVQPYLSKIMATSFFRKETLEQTRQAIVSEIFGFPKALRRFLENMRSGRTQMQVAIPELNHIHKSIENIGWKLYLGLLSLGLVIGLSIIIATTQIISVYWTRIIFLLGIIALIIAIFKGTTSKPNL